MKLKILPVAVGAYLQCLCGNARRDHDYLRCAAALARADWALASKVKTKAIRWLVVNETGRLRKLRWRATGETMEVEDPSTGRLATYKVMKKERPKNGEVYFRAFRLRSFNAKAQLAGLEPIPHPKITRH